MGHGIPPGCSGGSRRTSGLLCVFTAGAAMHAVFHGIPLGCSGGFKTYFRAAMGVHGISPCSHVRGASWLLAASGIHGNLRAAVARKVHGIPPGCFECFGHTSGALRGYTSLDAHHSASEFTICIAAWGFLAVLPGGPDVLNISLGS